MCLDMILCRGGGGGRGFMTMPLHIRRGGRVFNLKLKRAIRCIIFFSILLFYQVLFASVDVLFMQLSLVL